MFIHEKMLFLAGTFSFFHSGEIDQENNKSVLQSCITASSHLKCNWFVWRDKLVYQWKSVPIFFSVIIKLVDYTHQIIVETCLVHVFKNAWQPKQENAEKSDLQRNVCLKIWIKFNNFSEKCKYKWWRKSFENMKCDGIRQVVEPEVNKERKMMMIMKKKRIASDILVDLKST